MKKIGFFASAAAASLLAVGLLVGMPVHASSASQVAQGVMNHSVYKAGSTVFITGTVNGDIFCAGQAVTIDATVNGDVLCAGQDITVGGKVNGSVRLVGQTVDLSGTVTHSAAIAGQTVVVEGAAHVGQDASLAGKTITVDGAVGRDLTGAGSTVMLGGKIGRNVSLRVNDLTLGSVANITGDLTYTGPHMLQRGQGAQLHGTVTYHQATAVHGHGGGVLVWFKLYWLVTLLTLALVLVALFPRLFRSWNPVRWSEFGWSLLVGFVAMFVMPAVIALLFATVIGVPIGVLLVLFWIAAALVAWPLAAYFIGARIVPKLHPVLIVLIGGVALAILEFIPVLGWIVAILAYWTGIGILLRGIRHSYRKPVYTDGDSKT